jgi:hypothetical protein
MMGLVISAVSCRFSSATAVRAGKLVQSPRLLPVLLKADGTWEIPAATGVTSVAVTAPSSLLTVTDSPITSSGTVALAIAAQAPNLILAGPISGTPLLHRRSGL